MTWQSTLVAALAIIGLLTLVFFAGRWTKPEPKIITEYVTKTDTLIIWRDAEIRIVYRDRPAIQAQPHFFTAHFDTTIVIDSDSVIVSQDIGFNDSSRTFTNILDLELRKMQAIITDSIFVTKVKEVEVVVDQPFYDTFWFGTVFTLIATAIIAIFI